MKHSIPQFRLGLALVLVSLLGQAFAQSSPVQVAGSTWQAYTSSSPAVAASRTTKYVAWVDQTSNEIWFCSYNGKSFTTPTIVEGSGFIAETDAAPAAAWDFGQSLLWLAWKGLGGKDIWYSTWDPTSSTWSIQARVEGSGWTAETTESPTLGYAAYVYLAWKGAADDRIYYSNWNDPGWEEQTVVNGMDWTAETTSAPAIDPGTQGPVMFWRGSSSGQHLWASFLDASDNSWSAQQEISCTSPPAFNPATDTSPAAMELVNGLLIIPTVDVVFWKDASSTAVKYSDNEGAIGGCVFSPPVQVSGSGWSAQTYFPPSVATAQTYSNAKTTVLGWTAAGYNTIYILDPTTLPGLLTY